MYMISGSRVQMHSALVNPIGVELLLGKTWFHTDFGRCGCIFCAGLCAGPVSAVAAKFGDDSPASAYRLLAEDVLQELSGHSPETHASLTLAFSWEP